MSVRRPNHIEQDAIIGEVFGFVEALSPELGAEGIRVSILCNTIILSIFKKHYNADIRVFQLQVTRYFEHHPDSAGTVIGGIDGFFLVNGILICPGAAIPVRAKQDLFMLLRMNDTYYIPDVQYSTVICFY